VQSFTAIGRIRHGEPFRIPSFSPMRRNVTYFTHKLRQQPLLDELSFILPGANWGLPCRRGLIEVSERDMRVIANAMKALFDAP